MPMVNTDCVPSIATDRGVVRRVVLRALPALSLALPGALLLCAADLPRPDPVFPFSREIEAFAKANDAGTPLANATLFLGSSSIRLWDVMGSFPDIPTINRGFGGASTTDVLHYYPRLLPRSRPRSIVVYVGENDLAGGGAPEKVARNVLTLLGKLRADYPRAHIVFLSLKPSPIRWTLWPKMAAVNMTVAARSRAMGFDYLDVAKSLLAPDGLPDASLFRTDGLHMNPRGYRRWTSLVDSYLDRALLADAGRDKTS